MLDRFAERWMQHGADPVEAMTRAGASVAGIIGRQAQLLSYLDAFELLGWVYLAMMPLVFVLRRHRIDGHDGARPAAMSHE